MQETVQFSINFGGDYHKNITEMTAATGKLNEEVKKSQDLVGKLGQTFMGFKAFNDVVRDVANGFGEFTKGGITLDSQMHDLSAVAGVTGDTLRQIEGYARASAKTFGTDASVAVEGYKLLLSQLTPELAKCPEALSAMGDSIQITSKLMGGDGVAAAQVLTTAMNQYGVSMDDPIAASREMARLMHVMAAAGQAGSAELPAISAALSQCGMAAKAANVSFEETNAAIQVLDKAGKKASEGGVALRNTLAILGRGRFLPPKTQEELAAAGIDIDVLADKNLSLHDRLEALKPILRDDALLSQMFGMENANAARALIQGTDALRDFTDAVTGTNSAEEQAAIVMDSYAERQARINQRIEDFKISLFQATGDLTLWVGSLMECLVPVAQLTPLISGIWKGMQAIKALQWATMLHGIQLRLAGVTAAAMLNCQTMGLLPGLWATFTTVASTACRAVGTAIHSIPIIGWIALAITGLTILWNKCATFRGLVKGLWEGLKGYFLGLWESAKNIFGSIADLIQAAFNLDWQGIKNAIKRFNGTYEVFGQNVASGIVKGLEAYRNETAEKSSKGAQPEDDGSPSFASGLSPMSGSPSFDSPLSGSGGGLTKADHIRNINIRIDRLVERLEVTAANLPESAERIRDEVTRALMGALNDVQLAM